MLLILLILTIIVITIAVMFFRRYTIVRVNEVSMMPTYRHGDFLFLDRRFSFTPYHNLYYKNMSKLNELKGRIFVYISPHGIPVIKRLVEISYSGRPLMWFEGDNKENSRDSRDYGFITDDVVLGEVVDFKTAIKNTLRIRRNT